MVEAAPLTARYDTEREVGRGGVGAVYLARDRTLDRLVALKVLPSEVASDTALRDRCSSSARDDASRSLASRVTTCATRSRRCARNSRQPLSPTAFYTPPIGLAALFTALGFFGASFVMLMLSPIREPIAERLPRLIWMGPVGRVFLRLAMGRRVGAVATGTGSAVRSSFRSIATPELVVRSAPSAPSPVTLPVAPVDRLAALEARVTALEACES